MPLSPEDLKDIATVVATTLAAAQQAPTPTPTPTPTPAATPAPADDAPLTRADLKSLLGDIGKENANAVLGEVFKDRMQSAFNETPGFQKFFEEGSDYMDKPYLETFNAMTDAGEKAKMLKNLQKNFLEASMPAAGSPTPDAPKSEAQQTVEDNQTKLEEKFSKGEITAQEHAAQFWDDFMDVATS